MIRTDVIRPLRELLAGHARSMPGKVAFRDPLRAVTYAELAERTRRLGEGLAARGVAAGERVAIYCDNGVSTVESYLGIVQAAAIGVCINPSVAEAELAYMLEDSGASVVITDSAHFERVAALALGLPRLSRIILTDGTLALAEAARATVPVEQFEEVIAGRVASPAVRDLGLDEPAWMIYTSGTTGRPKGVLLTQRGNLWVAAACWLPVCGISARDYVLSPLPLFHSYALNLTVVAILASGASEYILPRFSTHEVLRLLRSEPFTVMPGVPTMFHYLLEAGRHEGLQAHAMRLFISAGAIMTKTLNETFEAAFRVPLLDGYGITETSTMVTMNWPNGGRPLGSCGLPLPGSTVRIVDRDGQDVSGSDDGELWVAGPHVMLGYYNKPAETAAALEGGWYRTGDLGRRDADGYITITGRIKELIIRGGENIYPAEVEDVLVQHEDVLDCAVCSKPDEALGEIVVAFVVPRPGRSVDAEVLRLFCRGRLTAFKIPSEVHVAQTIPRTGSGKILRYKLQQQLASV